MNDEYMSTDSSSAVVLAELVVCVRFVVVVWLSRLESGTQYRFRDDRVEA